VTTFTASNPVVFDAAAGQPRRLSIRTSGSSRWEIGADGTAEVGSNAGSLFVINRFSDAGASLGSAVSIDRSTGVSTLQALSVAGATALAGSFVVTAGGYLINRRVIPRLYLESPNQTNGYYIDSNVSDAVFGNLTIRRRDNAALLFSLNNAAQITDVFTITTTGAITAGGILTGRTQTRVQNADNSHSLRLEIGGDNSKNILTTGASPLLIGHGFGINDQPVHFYNASATRMTLTSAGALDFAAGGRIAFRPDAVVGHTTDLPSHAVINLSANYHNNNLLGVSAEHGVYAASDAGFSWLFKSGATWRNVMDLNIGAAGASVLLFDGQISDVTGNVRDIVTVQRNASANFTPADRGKAIVKDNTTAYNWTCATTSGVKDQAVTVVNDGTAGNVTIVQGASMTVISGTTTGNFTLTPGQSRTLLWLSSTRVRVL
jgi:hypothetical protein